MAVHTKCSGLFAVACGALVISMPASAAPIVNFDVTVLGGTGGPFNTAWAQAGVPTATPGVFNFNQTNSPFPAGLNGPGNEWSISVWDFAADDDPAGAGAAAGARLGSVFTVTNNLPEGPNAADNHLYFSIYINMNVHPAAQPTSFFGNGGMTLTAPGGSGPFNQITAVGGPIWNYQINGADVASLYPAGFNLGLSGPGTNSTSANLSPAQTGPLAGLSPTSIGIRLDFDLTPGETVTFNGVFAYVPTPGGLALLGLAGLARGRRRRN
jgi:hypothetical protein